MLHEEIKTKNHERLVILQLADDIKEDLSIFDNYKVEVEDDRHILIFTMVGVFTGLCVERIQSIVKAYQVKYDGIKYSLGISRSTPVVYIWVQNFHL